MENIAEFGNYIQSLRKGKRLTLKVVADELAIDVSMLCKIKMVRDK